MARKINCWEYKKCGREPNGDRVNDLGTCHAAMCASADGVNGGINGGRMCWAIVGTYSFDKSKSYFTRKIFFCSDCKFYKKVLAEEGIIRTRHRTQKVDS